MKFCILILFCFQVISSCSQVERKPNSITNPIKHIVFDIDWTIAAKLENESKFSQRVISVGSEKYFIYEGLEEMIEELSTHPEVRISFFSGGSNSRNHQLLRSIKLSNGKSLEEISYKILNFEDLTVVKNASINDAFSNRYKKDLTKISNDLTNLIMVDDTEHFVLDSNQEDHVLFLGPTYKHFEKYAEAKIESGPYIPKSYSEWSYAEKKLFLVKSALVNAIEQTDTTTISFSEALNNQKNQLEFNSGQWNNYTQNLYRLNKRLYSTSCFDLVRPML